MAAILSCPRCSQRLPVDRFVSGRPAPCPACHSEVVAYVFAALDRDETSRSEIRLAREGESVCFFHSRYPAIAPCDDCGRFLCETCLVNVGSRQLCADCVSHLRRKKDPTGLVNYSALFDNVALILVTLPMVTIVFAFLTILSAPVSLFLAFFYWSRQWTLLPRSRLRFVLAIVLAALLTAGWALLIYHLATQSK
jgi:hypothetical protein